MCNFKKSKTFFKFYGFCTNLKMSLVLYQINHAGLHAWEWDTRDAHEAQRSN